MEPNSNSDRSTMTLNAFDSHVHRIAKNKFLKSRAMCCTSYDGLHGLASDLEEKCNIFTPIIPSPDPEAGRVLSFLSTASSVLSD